MWAHENKCNNKINKINFENLIITDEKKENAEKTEVKYELNVKYQDIIVAHAIYQFKNDIFFLNWLETKEAFQGRGLGSYVLNYLSEQAIKKNADLTIHALDMDFIDNFCFKWFRKRVDPKNSSSDKVKRYFNSLVEDSANPKLKLKIQDLKWQPWRENRPCYQR